MYKPTQQQLAALIARLSHLSDQDRILVLTDVFNDPKRYFEAFSPLLN